MVTIEYRTTEYLKIEQLNNLRKGHAMDNNNFMSPADMAAVLRDNDNGWGGNSWWILLLFICLFNGGGMWGGNRSCSDALANQTIARAATTDDVATCQWRQDLSGQVRGITGGLADLGYSINTNIAQTRYDLADRSNNNAYNILSTLNNMAANQEKCCCENKQLISDTKYDLTNAIHAEGEATRALLQSNKIENLEAQLNQLQIQATLFNFGRYNAVNNGMYGPYYGGYYGTTF